MLPKDGGYYILCVSYVWYIEMSSVEISTSGPRRQRLSREERKRQLIDTAWRIVQEAGTEALTLGHLSEKAGVTKPVVYDHFGDRNGLLAALYLEFDARQNAKMDEAIAASAPTPEVRAEILADAYVGCVLTQGREIPGVIAALAGSPELDRIRRECEVEFLEKCRQALAPASPSGQVSLPALRAMLGAAEALSAAATTDELTPEDARRELKAVILDLLARQARR